MCKPECLPSQEIKKAILLLIEQNYGASRDQLHVEVARLFGFKATSTQLREVIEQQIQALVKAGILQDVDGQMTLQAKSALA